MLSRYSRPASFLLLILALSTGLAGSARASYKDSFAELLELYYGNVCSARIEGWVNKTLRVDWTPQTNKFHVMKVFAEVGEAKEQLYRDGVRYFKFPNDVGGYNIIDWKTGRTESVTERAPYYFTN